MIIACAAHAQSTSGVVTTDDEYDVTVVFLGLMTFNLPPSDKNVATVILPNVSDGFDEIGDDKHKVHPHVAYLLSDIDSLPERHPLNKNHDFHDVEEKDINKVAYHYIRLKGEQIAVDDEHAVAALNKPLWYLNSGCKTSSLKPCPDKDTETALCWLSSMREVHGGAEQKKDEKNYFNRFAPSETVAARTTLRHGDLRAHVVAIAGKAPVWEFATPKQGPGHENDVTVTQALAEEVHWTFRAKGTPFILNLLAFDDSDSRRVAFMPNKDKKLQIIIANTMKEDAGPIGVPTELNIDEHYSVYHLFKDIKKDGKPLKDGKGRIPHEADAEPCTKYVFEPTLKGVPQDEAEDEGGDGGARNVAPKPHDHRFALDAKKSSKYYKIPDPTPGALNCTANQWP